MRPEDEVIRMLLPKIDMKRERLPELPSLNSKTFA